MGGNNVAAHIRVRSTASGLLWAEGAAVMPYRRRAVWRGRSGSLRLPPIGTRIDIDGGKVAKTTLMTRVTEEMVGGLDYQR